MEVDATREMNRLTLAIAGMTLLGVDVEGEADEIGRALTDALGLFDRLHNPLGPLLDRLPVPGTLRMRRARERLDATIYRAIAERRASGEDRDDLLGMLLAARDEEGDGGGMTDLQLRDELLTLFLAGHETTANALAWTWHLLALNPGAEAKLHGELRTVLAGRSADGGRLRRAAVHPCRLRGVDAAVSARVERRPAAAGGLRGGGLPHPRGEHRAAEPVDRPPRPALVGRRRGRVPPGAVAGRRTSRPRFRALPTSPSAGGRASASARGLRGWRACSRWPPWRAAGACATPPAST